MYALPSAAPYGYHLPANPKYALQHRSTLPVQYIYQPASSAYSNTPHLPPNSLPLSQLVHSTVNTDYHHHQTPRQRPRPISRGSEADRHPFPYSDNEFDIRTQPKQSVFSSFMSFARGRSKSRGRAEPDPTARPRSRGAFTDDGHGAKDPRYVDARRGRRLSGEKQLIKAKHESLKSFDKSMESLEKSLRAAPLQQEDPYRVASTIHRSSTKEDLRRKYEEEDRLRQHEEYQRSQHPSSRNRAASPDVLIQSPTLLEHTQLNSLPPDSGYHTDAPPKSARRSSMPLHAQMQRPNLASPREKSAPALKVPEGFFNRRGDQLMNSKGDVLRRPPHMEYPPEFAAYPPPGTGWRDHKGQVRYSFPARPSAQPTSILTHPF